MNKYDDIKRFMDKAKLENLDYKELNDKSTGESITGSMNQWTLIKQVSASEDPAGPLDNGRTTQPTPQSVSADEFILTSAQREEHDVAPPSLTQPVAPVKSPIFSSEVPPPVAGHGLLDAVRETLPTIPAQPARDQHSPAHPVTTLHAQSVIPDNGSGLLDSLRKAMPTAQPPASPVAPVATSAPISTPVPLATPAPVAPASPVPDDTHQRFKHMFKQRAPQPTGAYVGRDTPLQPLLEMIASCR